MNLNKNEKIVLKKYLDSIIICICSFISEDEMNIYLEKSQTIPELLEHISNSLKTRELDGWEGDDLKEEQLTVTARTHGAWAHAYPKIWAQIN